MYINNFFDIIRKDNGDFLARDNRKTSTFRYVLDAATLEEIEKVYATCRLLMKADRSGAFQQMVDDGVIPILATELDMLSSVCENTSSVSAPEPLDEKEVLQKGLQKIIDFFSEFQFEPNFRFVNTFSRNLAVSTEQAKNYILSYFELTDSPFTNDIREKMKSPEFSSIVEEMNKVAPTHVVNNRFKLYYGSQGTGKTTIAQTETENRCVVCNNSMLPADLMEDFTFSSGEATFIPSMLWKCMEEGTALVLDEINLLPFDSLRFLQGILDGKSEFQYKGKTVHIKDGFMVIGTMNLTVNGMTYGLPEPLVDRCVEMKKFRLTPKCWLVQFFKVRKDKSKDLSFPLRMYLDVLRLNYKKNSCKF